MNDDSSAAIESRAGSPSRWFWVGMAVGWTAFFGMQLLSIYYLERVEPLETLLIAAANTLPPALVSIVVGFNRRRLLRPEWSLAKTIGVHAVVGVLFAVSTAGLMFLFVGLVSRVGEISAAGGQIRFGALLVASTFIYAIFLGFLMWSESIRRVHDSRKMAAREAVLRAEAEARAIRAQFNPHFVFNTLHSLMLLVRSDPVLAERAIEDVAALIRYASIIQRNDLDAVPLARELEIARRYVGLERMRLEHRLRVEWSVDVDPESVTIPAFTLQTVVENAIKHGLEPLPEGGRITVEVSMRDGSLEVSVEDDGRGADPRSVERASGRGLALLADRLDARYGDRGSLVWETEEGEGFRVEMSLPAEAPDRVPSLDVIAGETGRAPTPETRVEGWAGG